MEVNFVAIDSDKKIMSSYVLENILQQDYEKFFKKDEIISYEDRIQFLKVLYHIMCIRVTPSERYDVRVKEAIISRALMEDDFMEATLRWKKKLNFYPRDVMAEYKFMTECKTIENLLSFFDDNKEYTFSLIFVKPYE